MEQQLEVSLYTAINSLIQSGYRYAVIGGIALSQWEIIRATYDIDIKVLVQDLNYSSIRNYLYSIFPKIARNDTPENPFIVSVKVEDVTVDFLLTLPGYEELIIERATQRQMGGMEVWISSAEDLIIQKAITKRIKDWQDVEGLLITQYKKLDYKYIEGWLIQFAEALEQPDLLENYHKLVDKAANTHNSYS